MRWGLLAYLTTTAFVAAHENCLASVIHGINKRSFLAKRQVAERKPDLYAGEHNPEHWGSLPNSTLCAVCPGQHQTPVDFLHDSSLLQFKHTPGNDLPDIIWAKYAHVEFVNTGNTIEVELGDKVPEQTTLTFPSQPNEEYVLQQFHFHDPSEHTVMGHAYPLEMHFVFKSKSDKLAVFGVFLQFSKETDEGSLIPQLIHHLPHSPEKPSEIHHLDLRVMFENMDRGSQAGFFRILVVLQRLHVKRDYRGR